MNWVAARTEFFCNDHFDHSDSRYRLPVSDWGRVAAERKEWRPGRGFRRSGQPDGVWPARRGFGSFPGDDLVRNHFHAHVDHAFDFCGAPNRAHFRAFGSEAVADEVTASDTRSVRTAERSAKPGADTQITCWWRAGRPRPAAILMDGRDARRSIVLLATRSSPQEGILFPFLSNGRSCAVPWNHDSVIGQGQNAVVQGAHDLLKRSSGEIGASNAAGEQRVSGDQ